jgi:hypothetical protein
MEPRGRLIQSPTRGSVSALPQRPGLAPGANMSTPPKGNPLVHAVIDNMCVVELSDSLDWLTS